MAKIKFKNNTSYGGKIHKKGSVVDLSAKEADRLVEAEHAEEHVEPKLQQQQQQQPPAPPAPPAPPKEGKQ